MRACRADAGLVRKVVLTMRRESAVEIFGNSLVPDREMLARQIVAAMPACVGLHALCDDRGEPVALVGTLLQAPGRAAMLFIANSGFPGIAIGVHRWWHRTFVPCVLMQFRRVEFTGGADEKSSKWLRSMGFEREGTARAFARDGADFGYWAWLHPDTRREIDARRRGVLSIVRNGEPG